MSRQPMATPVPEPEQIVGAALEWSEGDINPLFWELFGVADWQREGRKAYPPNYVYGKTRFPAPAVALRRLRSFLVTVPRANPLEYDILLNIEGSDFIHPGPTWDIVKWVKFPEPQGYLPHVGWVTNIVLEPLPVHSFSALERGPASLGDRDFEELRKHSTTLRDPGEISEELLERNLKRQAEEEQKKIDEDLDFAEYYRKLFKAFAEDLGI